MWDCNTLAYIISETKHFKKSSDEIEFSAICLLFVTLDGWCVIITLQMCIDCRLIDLRCVDILINKNENKKKIKEMGMKSSFAIHIIVLLLAENISTTVSIDSLRCEQWHFVANSCAFTFHFKVYYGQETRTTAIATSHNYSGCRWKLKYSNGIYAT